MGQRDQYLSPIFSESGFVAIDGNVSRASLFENSEKKSSHASFQKAV
jgi:hypothetical protein